MARANGREDIAEGQRSRPGWSPIVPRRGSPFHTRSSAPESSQEPGSCGKSKCLGKSAQLSCSRESQRSRGPSEARNITRRWEAEGDRFALNLGRKLPRTDGPLQVSVKALWNGAGGRASGRRLGLDEIMNGSTSDDTDGYLRTPHLCPPLATFLISGCSKKACLSESACAAV